MACLSLAGGALAAPVNDNFDSPIVLPGGFSGSANAVGDVTGATRQAVEDVAGFNGAAIWFSWTAPTTGFYRFNTNGSAQVDTELAVLEPGTQADGSDADLLAYNDENPSDSWSTVQFLGEAGVEYRIGVSAYFDNGGTVDLTWEKLPAPSDPPLPVMVYTFRNVTKNEGYRGYDETDAPLDPQDRFFQKLTTEVETGILVRARGEGAYLEDLGGAVQEKGATTVIYLSRVGKMKYYSVADGTSASWLIQPAVNAKGAPIRVVEQFFEDALGFYQGNAGMRALYRGGPATYFSTRMRNSLTFFNVTDPDAVLPDIAQGEPQKGQKTSLSNGLIYSGSKTKRVAGLGFSAAVDALIADLEASGYLPEIE
ncbi:MAG: hypothetical protein KDM91_22005 [Verrucomicrobiae bacterium]|nr:hypothetical protein [Verrucomicrobiae bacterium]